MRYLRLFCIVSLFTLTGSLLSSEWASAQTYLPSAKNALLFPGLSSPRLQFGTGLSTGGGPEISSATPDIPGSVSAWTIDQWHRDSIVKPNSMRLNDPETEDHELGIAEYSFPSADENSRLSVYFNPSQHRYVYGLYERDGTEVDAGGANLLLGTKVSLAQNNFAGTLLFQLEVKIAKAAVSYDSVAARTNGSVKAQVIAGFIVQSGNFRLGQGMTLFLQIPIATSGAQNDNSHFCSVGPKGNHTLIITQLLPNENLLPFAAQRGPLSNLQYNLNAHMKFVFDSTYRCRTPDGRNTELTFAHDVRNLQDWRVKAIYIGLETQNSDHRKSSKFFGPQGNVEVGVQIANPIVWRQ